MNNKSIKIESLSKKEKNAVNQGLKDVKEGNLVRYESVDDFLEEMDRWWKDMPKWKRALTRLWYRIKSLPHDIWWGLKWRIVPRHKYNRLHTGLPPGYYDPCYSIPRAIFVATEKFVEGTRDTVDWEDEVGHSQAWKTFTEAAEWFKQNKKILDEGGIPERLESETWEENWKRELAWTEEKNQHLMNIMKHIDYMWYP